MAEAKKRLLTYAGLKAIEDELENLKVVKRKEVAGKIKEARDAETPAAQAVKPPVKSPMTPSVSMASFRPFHSVFPKPSNGTAAPAPAKSIRG